MSIHKRAGNRAIVIGGSIAGMLAARVLSDFFEDVIVVERDDKPGKATYRKGVPQSAHGHVLLKKGEEILEELFPGIIHELIQNGSIQSDFASNLSWNHHGSWKVRFHSGLSIIQQSRPFLDWHIHRRLGQLPNIDLRYGCKVKKLLVNGTKIKGITVEKADGISIDLSAELVVDASGAGSLTPKWLEEMGFETPKKTEVKIDLFYASMIFNSLSGRNQQDSLLVYPDPPCMNKGGTISPIEGNRYLVTLFGYGEDAPPNDYNAFIKYAKTLHQLDVFEAIKHGVADSGVQVYCFPAMRRRHYESMSSFPSGLLVMGDAFCRVDPVFAQGMSIAAMEAEALRKILMKFKDLKRITRQFHIEASRIVFVPWLIALTEDFRFKHTFGKRPFGLSLLQWFVKKVVSVCSHNEVVYTQFMKVLHLKAHPVSLLKPRVLFQIVTVFRKNKHKKEKTLFY
jgi:2-polyprenyl-6-methoxyphenol hydroxylase-like FAD-dependent oxidoreductase